MSRTNKIISFFGILLVVSLLSYSYIFKKESGSVREFAEKKTNQEGLQAPTKEQPKDGPLAAGDVKKSASEQVASAKKMDHASAGDVAKTPAKVLPPKQECFTAIFRPGSQEKNQKGGPWTRQKNLVSLGIVDGLQEKNVCVRVGSDPVAHELVKRGNEWQLILGPIYETVNANIKVQYCVGTQSCRFSCDPPKDPLLDAIGVADDAASGDAVNWKGERGVASQEEKDLEKELTGLRTELEADRKAQEIGLFSEWEKMNFTPMVCKATKQASLQ